MNEFEALVRKSARRLGVTIREATTKPDDLPGLFVTDLKIDNAPDIWRKEGTLQSALTRALGYEVRVGYYQPKSEGGPAMFQIDLVMLRDAA